MTEPRMGANIPPGLVLWPAPATPQNRVCMLISDIHCTDCTVGDQTADESDWQAFFEQIPNLCRHPTCTPDAALADSLDELVLILNGDIVDLIRSSRWAESGVYPWDRQHPRFPEIAQEVLVSIAEIHGSPPGPHEDHQHSGFFYWLQLTASSLRAQGIKVTIVPIVGNHDKELQVLPEARRMFYETCLGLKADDLTPDYRQWVAAQLNVPDEPYPQLSVYFADLGMRLFATHGQWRDSQNIRATAAWSTGRGWQPALWQQEKYLPFSEPCFGDTVATGLLSRFIWVAKAAISGDNHSEQRLRRILDEMDLYRPSVKAVLRLLDEAKALAKEDPKARHLRRRIITFFGESLDVWLGHDTTWNSAILPIRLGLHVLNLLHKLGSHTVDVLLMRLMARLQEPEADISDSKLLTLPGFYTAYRHLGFRLHVEGHTHVALEADLQFSEPLTRRNYTYINLGTWRDRILPKRNRGFRRRGIGRALTIFAFARAEAAGQSDLYRFEAHDVTSWGDKQDKW